MLKIFPVTPEDWIVFVVTVSAYLILIFDTFHRRGVRSQSFFTHSLWAMIDIILFILIEEENGSSLMLVSLCVLFSLIMSILLIKYDKEKKWTESETQTLITIILVILFWLYSGSNLLGLILAVMAEIVAGWPQMKKSWESPGTRLTLLSYVLFLASYSISVWKAEDWQPKNVLFPLSFLVYCLFDTLPLIIKWWKIEKRYEHIRKYSA